MKKVIFACVHNAGRSQMAAALFNRYSDPSKAIAISAGTNPSDKVHPGVLQSMKEIDIDLSNAKPQLLTQELAEDAHLLVTMGCGETCPNVPGLKRLDWPLTDPKDKPLQEVAMIRRQIEANVKELLKELKVSS